MSIKPPPAIPWQVTGNHWLCLPCIHPMDASIHLAGVVPDIESDSELDILRAALVAL